MNFAVPPSLHAASFTWFIYDYILSFAEEVEFIWTQRKNWTTSAYLITKSLTLTMVVIETVVLVRKDLTSTSYVGRAICELMLTRVPKLLRCSDVHGGGWLFCHDIRRPYVPLAISHLTFLTSGFSVVSFDRGRCFMESGKLGIMPAGWLVGLGYQIYLAGFALAKVRQAYIHRSLLGSRVSLLALIVAGNLQY
ncbi:hypothetical protein AURDEDRAFT_162282 [Auricularia subglabra TFB-10046 SS5]|nr:hypothetical protein AURDEDRAFT_162282 [Auricularia subglabra TFB-10046 SS5]